MKKNRTWSALIVSIVITIIIIIIALYLLDKIVPFARDIKGVENGNISYYRANTALNEALLTLSVSNPGIESSTGTIVNGSWFTYQIMANGTTLPEPWLWNSEYDSNWSILAPGKPIQLILSPGITWSQVSDDNRTTFVFRIPDLNKDGIYDERLLGAGTGKIINWTLHASWDSLQSNGSQITINQINSQAQSRFAGINKSWKTLSGSTSAFNGFYNNNCGGVDTCTLKLSLINPLILTSGESIPYLEYQAHFNVPIPLQTAIIETQGYAGGFRKNITRFIQQMTTNEALDFTVFQ